MGSLLSRSVEIQISNNTRNITLKNPKPHFNCGYCSVAPLPELSPGSSDSCHIQTSYGFWGVAGVLVYEAESFTLAIYFSNPYNYMKYSMELGLELSPGKAHRGNLQDTYARMANGANSRASTPLGIKFKRIVVDRGHGTVQVSHGPVKVTATMSNTIDSVLTVVLEEEGGSKEEVRMQNAPRGGRHFQGSENPRDLEGDLVSSPGIPLFG